jgi:hypothetical protein
MTGQEVEDTMSEEYVAVACERCGKPMGYVIASGHTAWAHADCEHGFGAVAVEPVTAAPDGDGR